MLSCRVPATQQTLSIKAQAEPAVALPGIPVHLVLTVENKSSVAQKLPSRLTIEARPRRRALAEMKSREELAEMHRDLAPRK